jgi:hypothetical protein
MEIQLSVAKAVKYTSTESGDTLEVVERPMGGVSVVLVDGRDSGHNAKNISSMVVRKVISLLADGVRDGAAARAASDYLFMERGGTSSVYMNILSGHMRNIRPAITEVPLRAGTTIVMYTDGISQAGSKYGHSLDICSMTQAYLDEQEPSAQYVADSLLGHALRLDQNEPNDDMSVVVLRVISKQTDNIRRMGIRLPVQTDYNFDL